MLFNLLSVFVVFRRFLFSKRANAVIRRVSFVCLLGLVVSIGALVVIFNVMGGLGKSITENFLKTEPHIIISFNNKFSDKYAREQKNKILKLLNQKGLAEGVLDFYFFETIDLVVRTDRGLFSGAAAKGYSTAHLSSRFSQMSSVHYEQEDVLDYSGIINKPSSLANKQAQFLHKGLSAKEQALQENDKLAAKDHKTGEKKEPSGIIISWTLANELKVYEGEELSLIPAENLLLPPGEPVSFEWARLEHIVLAQDKISGESLFYDKKYFPGFKDSSSYVYGFEMRLIQPDQYFLYQTVLEEAGFSVQSWPSRNSSVFFALKVEKIIMSCFLSLAGLITLMAVSSLLVLLMLKKKKEIGILTAMGLPAYRVKKIFIGVGFLLCSLGVAGGWVLALLVCLALKYIPIPFLSHLYREALFPVEFHWPFLLMILAGAFVLAFFSCWISVWLQTKESPAELLKAVKR